MNMTVEVCLINNITMRHTRAHFPIERCFMKTYYIENENAEILFYSRTLFDSKYCLQKLVNQGYPINTLRIVMLQGQYFGEGFHKYYLTLNNDKKTFKRKAL